MEEETYVKTEVNKIRRRKKYKDGLTGWLFLMPSLIGVLLFFVVPFFIVIYYSFIDNIFNKNFVGLKNYRALLHNTAFCTAAKNTLSFSLLALPLSIIISLLLAMMLESNIPGKSRFRTFLLSPMMVPTASVLLIWQVLFDRHGYVNEIMKFFGKDSIDWLKSSKSQIVVLVLFLWKNLGYNMILFMAALASVPKDLLENASLDGASGLRRFFSIKLRYLMPTVFFVGIISLINTFKVFREVYLLAGNYPYDKLYMLQHYMNNTFRTLDYQKLSTAAIIMALVMTVIIAILFIVEDRLGKDFEG